MPVKGNIQLFWDTIRSASCAGNWGVLHARPCTAMCLRRASCATMGSACWSD